MDWTAGGNMKFILLFIMFSIFGIQTGYSQSDQETRRLRAAIDSLTMDLEKCRHSALYWMMDSDEAELSYPKDEEYTHLEYRQKLMALLQKE